MQAPEQDPASKGNADETPLMEELRTLHSSPNYLFWCLHKHTMALTTDVLAKFGAEITPVQHAVLIVAGAQPGIDQANLAALISYDRATTSGVLDRLQARGYLQRFEHPKDRRAKAIYLTEAGRNLLVVADTAARDARERILSELETSEVETLFALIDKLLPAEFPR